MINLLLKLFLPIILFFIIPLITILYFVVLIIDGKPVIFTQLRVGLDGKLFRIFKFRTMKINVGDIPTHRLKEENKLFTSSGPFLRKYSLDELPQVFNVIKGDIDFIGPRPALHNQDDLISQRKLNNILQQKPGITGWAQVNGRDNLSIEQKVEMEKFYLKNKSFFLDLKIIVMTAYQVLIPKNIDE